MITIGSETLKFDLPKTETDFIIKHNEFLSEHTTKVRLGNYCPNMEIIFMNTQNRKTNESHKIVLNLLQRLDLRETEKHVALQNLSITCGKT